MSLAKRLNIGTMYVESEDEFKVQKAEEKANESLMKYGIRVSLSPCRSQNRSGLTHYALTIDIDDMIGRNAGRKKKESVISIEEALNMEENGISKIEIATVMGISLATYYRRRSDYFGK